MTNINELRRLAQEATPGPWKIYDDGSNTQHIGDVSKTNAGWLYDTICNMHEDVSDNYDTNNDFKLFENSNNNAAFITAANPSAILELIDRLEAAENDALEQARLNGIGAERELALMAKLEAAEKERDTLQAKIAEMEKQEPVAEWLPLDSGEDTRRD